MTKSAKSSRTPTAPLRLGLVGCGAISNAYFKGLAPFPHLARITACSDLDPERARQRAAEHQVERVLTVDQLIADPDIDAVLNLTIPAVHASINLRALRAGKHSYCEKPYSLTYKEGKAVLAEAKKRKLRAGTAPDTVLGPGIMTCRQVIDDGLIGQVVGATANMAGHGHEHWHPSPEFYYQPGGGPLFDMGPYYLTSLVTMLGPVKNVTALAKATFKERTITSQPLNGKVIKVKTPTHLLGLLEFGKDVYANVTMSFDTWAHGLPMLEIYGTEGTLRCPDPNGFYGDVMVWTKSRPEWTNVPLINGGYHGKLERGVGFADLAQAIIEKRPERLNGELGLHITEVMESFHTSAASGRKLQMKSTCKRPTPLPAGFVPA